LGNVPIFFIFRKISLDNGPSFSFPQPIDKHRGYLVDGEDDGGKDKPIDAKIQDEEDDKSGDASHGQKYARGEEERRDRPIQNEIPYSGTS
jgi:hypothetical protein